MSLGTFGKGTLYLGKGLSKTIDDAYKKYIKGGGKKTKKTFTAEELSKKKQLNKAKQNRQKRNQVSKKEYEKTLPDTFKKKSTALVSLNKNIKNIAEKSLKDKPTGTAIIKKPSSNITKKPGTSLVVSNQSRNLVNIPKGSAGKQTSKNILNKQKESFLKRNKGKIAGGVAVLSTIPTLIDDTIIFYLLMFLQILLNPLQEFYFLL